MKTINIFCLILLAAVIFTSCKKDDDPVVPNEEEVITTVNVTLTPSGGGTDITLNFTDLDGDGGNNPTISGGTLTENTTYNGSIELLNATETPAEDITAEIQDEDEEHQFFFEAASGLNATTAYSDMDADGNPIGLSFTLTTTTASNGNWKVTLRHEPNKTASGVSGGDITNAGGETDIEIDFPITIQ